MKVRGDVVLHVSRGVVAIDLRSDPAGSQLRDVDSAGAQRIETICEMVEYDDETRHA